MTDKKLIGLGSNLNPKKNIELALRELSKVCSIVKVSHLYSTPALLPPKSPPHWNQSYLNCAAEIQTSTTPLELLKQLKSIEEALGPRAPQRWSPRSIDLDILFWEGRQEKLHNLTVPHPEAHNRAFVLDPLKDLDSNFIPLARQHPEHNPLWMSIYNVTPDSFSNAQVQIPHVELIKQRMTQEHQAGVHIFDFGAESTRPRATPLSPEEEKIRLKPVLQVYSALFSNEIIKPLLSLDTYKPQVAQWARQYGATIFNDVGGLTNPAWLELLKESDAKYILMHSLSVPANPNLTLKEESPIKALKNWLDQKIELLSQHKIDLSRIYFDPGIGFGKTAQQSLEILSHLEEFYSYPIQILVGHSRKSFMNNFTNTPYPERDHLTLGASLKLIQKNVDVLRVHNPIAHIDAYKGWQNVKSHTY